MLHNLCHKKSKLELWLLSGFAISWSFCKSFSNSNNIFFGNPRRDEIDTLDIVQWWLSG